MGTSAHRSARRIAAAALCAAALAACGGSSGAPAPRGTPLGEVRGQVLRAPVGPAGPVPVGGDPVEARDAGGGLAATTLTDAAGRLVLNLGPGGYRLVESTCGVGQQIEIRTGAVVTVTITVPDSC